MSVISEITVQTLTPYKQIIRYKQVSSQEGLCDTKEYSTVHRYARKKYCGDQRRQGV